MYITIQYIIIFYICTHCIGSKVAPTGSREKTFSVNNPFISPIIRYTYMYTCMYNYINIYTCIRTCTYILHIHINKLYIYVCMYIQYMTLLHLHTMMEATL